MVKVETEVQRNNANRKRRLRKKLHVGEFGEFAVHLRVPDLATSVDMDEDDFDKRLDYFFDVSEEVLKPYDAHTGWCAVSNYRHTMFMFCGSVNILTDEVIDNIVRKIEDGTSMAVYLDEVNNAWYPA